MPSRQIGENDKFLFIANGMSSIFYMTEIVLKSIFLKYCAVSDKSRTKRCELKFKDVNFSQMPQLYGSPNSSCSIPASSHQTETIPF
jgi:hypothetical protein